MPIYGKRESCHGSVNLDMFLCYSLKNRQDTQALTLSWVLLMGLPSAEKQKSPGQGSGAGDVCFSKWTRTYIRLLASTPCRASPSSPQFL